MLRLSKRGWGSIIIHPKEIYRFRDGINIWYKKNGLRDFPWRKIDDQFQILITEIFLRRTRAEAVKKIWHDFFSKYQSFGDINSTTDKLIIKDIESLGLVNHRLQTIKSISKELENKKVPNKEEKLTNLFGIGIYISRMYLLMYRNSRKMIYDSNFRRLYNRYFGLSIIEDLKRDKEIETISDKIIPKRKYKQFILTILDFSALQCKPVTPVCTDCPLKKHCNYFHLN